MRQRRVSKVLQRGEREGVESRRTRSGGRSAPTSPPSATFYSTKNKRLLIPRRLDPRGSTAPTLRPTRRVQQEAKTKARREERREGASPPSLAARKQRPAMPPTKAELAFIRDATGALDEDINAAFAAKNNDVNETVEFLISSTLSFFLLLSLLQLNNTPPPPPAKRGPLGARLLLFPPRRRARPGTMLSSPALSVSARRQRLGPRRRAARQKRLPFGAPSPLLSLSCSPPSSSSLCLRFQNQPPPPTQTPSKRSGRRRRSARRCV